MQTMGEVDIYIKCITQISITRHTENINYKGKNTHVIICLLPEVQSMYDRVLTIQAHKCTKRNNCCTYT